MLTTVFPLFLSAMFISLAFVFIDGVEASSAGVRRMQGAATAAGNASSCGVTAAAASNTCRGIASIGVRAIVGSAGTSLPGVAGQDCAAASTTSAAGVAARAIVGSARTSLPSVAVQDRATAAVTTSVAGVASTCAVTATDVLPACLLTLAHRVLASAQTISAHCSR